MNVRLDALLSVRSLLIVLGTAMLLYTGIRADRLSMTHDESSTYLNTYPQSVLECLYDAKCWQTANLHMTNTLGMQIGVPIFGANEWGVRSANVIGHLVYLIFSFLLVTRLTKNAFIQVMGFLVLNANPYLLDFFSLARGYGLANVGMMVSLYYLVRTVQEPRIGYAWGIALGGAFAVLSNFTWLIFYAALGPVIVLILIAGREGVLKPRSLFTAAPSIWKSRWQPLLPWLIVGLVMGALLFFPLTQLSKLGEFKYGNDSLWWSFHYLIVDSLYGESYFSHQTIRVFKWLSIFLSLGAIGLAGLGFLKGERSVDQRLFQVSCALIVIILLGLVMQYYLLGAKYVINRKAVFFIPLGGLMLTMLMIYLLERWRLPVQVFAGMVAVFAVWHATRFANVDYVREWYYDAGTRDMVEYVQTEVPEGETVRLGLHWLYTHSTQFYRETRNLDFFHPIEYSKELRTDDYFDYYYVPREEGKKLSEAYELVRDFEFAGSLYRRKGLPVNPSLP